MATFGAVSEFNSDIEGWTEYSERLTMFFLANDIAADKKVAVLLSCVGAKTYKLIKDLTSPTLPSAKTFAQIETLLTDHFTLVRVLS